MQLPTRVVERAGFRPYSHMYKNLLTVLQEYPRDELFQIGEDALLETALGILRLGDRRKIRVFIRRDVFGRFYSCLVFLPSIYLARYGKLVINAAESGDVVASEILAFADAALNAIARAAVKVVNFILRFS